MNINIPATLELSRFQPVGKFSFSFSKKTHVRKTGATILNVGECNTTHLPVTFTDDKMKVLHAIMKREHTDVFFDGMHCYTTTKNCLVMVKHPLLTEWIKKNF